MEEVRWGVLGTAKIAAEHVIPALMKSKGSQLVAIGSRDLARAQETADRFGIPKAHGSYEALLADPEVEAIYNPLPNHLHVPWSEKAAERGKHVLCEKPIALTATEAQRLIDVRDRTGVLIQEAFMVRCHPQWRRARDLVRQGQIGDLRAVQTFFSFMNRDPENIRNIVESGGGAIYDIGCYPIVISRFLFDEEPLRVVGLMERDPDMGTDRLTSAILDFPSGQASFVCSTQLVGHQRVEICGTKGRIEVVIPFNAPADETTRIYFDGGSEPGGASAQAETVEAADQYALQADLFSEAIRNGGGLAFPLEDSVKNMRVIDAVYRSARSGTWEEV